MKPCLTCGEPTQGTRCSACAKPYASATYHNPLYDSLQWRRLRSRLLKRHRFVHGDWCPGWADVPAHAASDLTVDHVTPLSKGGKPFDAANLVIRCRSCNSRKGSRA